MNQEKNWIATRMLCAVESPEIKVEVKIAKPEQVTQEEWRCAYSINQLSSDEQLQYAYGLDSFQALLMAFAGVRASLEKMELKFTWKDVYKNDHGVPQYVPQSLGVDFSRKIEKMIDLEVVQFTTSLENKAREALR